MVSGTASAHWQKTKLGIMLDFHYVFFVRYNILILCGVMLQMERRDYNDN